MASNMRLGSMILLFGLCGCFDPPEIPEGLECSRFNDCPPKQRCFEGICRVNNSAPLQGGADGGSIDDELSSQLESQPLALEDQR